MTREELLAAVNEKEDTGRLTSLSQQTIAEELDDLLSEYGEGEEPDDKAVERLARRMKRMAGNIHAGVSAEMKKNREEAERRRREAEAKRKRDGRARGDGGEGDSGGDGSGDDGGGRIAALEARLTALTEMMEAREKASRKAAVLDAVKNGLRAKFEAAGLEVNDYFVEAALGKVDIPGDGDADVAALVEKAEGIYTSDYRRATGRTGVPRAGSGRQGGEEQRLNPHEWDDIKDACKNWGAGGRVR